MSARTILLLCLASIANLQSVSAQSAKLLNWSIDPSSSYLTLSGTLYSLDDIVFGTLEPQGPGSLTANISGSGTVPVAVTTLDDELTGFASVPETYGLSRPFIPLVTNQWQPNGSSTAFGGVFDGGDFGSVTVSLGYVSGSVSSNQTQLVPQGNSTYSFDADAFLAHWEGSLSFLGEGPLFEGLVGSGSIQIETPTTTLTQQAGSGSLTVSGDTMTLTIPVNQTQDVASSFFYPFRAEITTSGQIVANAPVGLLAGPFPNGSFENPTLDPWSGNGIATEDSTYTPTDGTKALVQTATTNLEFVYDPVFDQWDFAFVQHTGFNSVDFIANAGDVLSFDYYVDASPDSDTSEARVDISVRPILGSTFFPIVSVQGTESVIDTAGWESAAIRLDDAGIYRLNASSSAMSRWGLSTLELGLDNVRLTPLGAFENPVMPNTVVNIPGQDNPVFVFENIPSGQWFDPPTASGFIYTMTSDSLFTAILDFPSGFDNPFAVTANNQFLGLFQPGETVDFISLLGVGVASFKISGIAPLVDPEDPLGFPLKLAFNTPTASFTMQAVPESHSLLLGLFATVTLGIVTIRQRWRVA